MEKETGAVDALADPPQSGHRMRLLLVEDSDRLRGIVAKALRRTGYRVDETGDGKEGLDLAQDHDYDVAILDIMLPSLDGLTILERLRGDGIDTPVIFLTARDGIGDRVEGLRRGADDYLVKPFALEELLARIEALSRRTYQKSSNEVRVADLLLDGAAKRISRQGSPLDLTSREYALLEYLMLRAGHVVSRAQIEEHIYDDFVNPMSNVVDSAIYTLRRKIAIDADSKPLIHTRRGQGYILEER
ncbi:MAG: response regulator transcription factor [Verrucomicrobiota bacterium]